MSFGHDRERAVKKRLEEDGWIVVRSPASLGLFDLTAVKDGVIRFVEVKATKAGPYSGFGPEDRRELLEAAERAGAVAELAWWPKRGTLVWIGSEAWPK